MRKRIFGVLAYLVLACILEFLLWRKCISNSIRMLKHFKCEISKLHKTFTFIVNCEEFQTSRIISDFLSPTISQNHLIDPTNNSFTIKTKKKFNKKKYLMVQNLYHYKIFLLPPYAEFLQLLFEFDLEFLLFV